eukprot:2431658-Amphidinium_carterae.6
MGGQCQQAVVEVRDGFAEKCVCGCGVVRWSREVVGDLPPGQFKVLTGAGPHPPTQTERGGDCSHPSEG